MIVSIVKPIFLHIPDQQAGYAGPPIPPPQEQQVTVPPIGPDELPPPYTPTAAGGVLMINCKVCQAMVSLEGKTNQHVVKCHICNEATVGYL